MPTSGERDLTPWRDSIRGLPFDRDMELCSALRVSSLEFIGIGGAEFTIR
jgi:hypothetical protein